MSLILDALRKAEAERQRGAVPGVHSVAAPPPPRPRRRPWGPAAGVLLGLGLLGAAGLWLALRPGPAAAPSQAQAQAAGATPPPATPVPPGPAPGPLPVVVSAPLAPPAAMAAATPPAPPHAASPLPSPPPSPPPSSLRPAAAAPATAPILTQVRRLADLPPEQRRELPPLVVGGSVWSEQASARFVVLDGQVLREGEAAAAGLVLVKLAPRSATLRWRDTLIEVPF